MSNCPNYDFTIEGCRFEDNRAASTGGAIDSDWAIISDSFFLDNEAGSQGGAVYVAGQTRSTESGYEGNRAGSEGGAIQSSGCAAV